MGVGPEPDRDTRGDDPLALEEIRRLFDRYRQIARHGMVTERDEIEEITETEEPPALTCADAAALGRRHPGRVRRLKPARATAPAAST
jgi:hypothetical protein